VLQNINKLNRGLEGVIAVSLPPASRRVLSLLSGWLGDSPGLFWLWRMVGGVGGGSICGPVFIQVFLGV